ETARQTRVGGARALSFEGLSEPAPTRRSLPRARGEPAPIRPIPLRPAGAQQGTGIPAGPGHTIARAAPDLQLLQENPGRTGLLAPGGELSRHPGRCHLLPQLLSGMLRTGAQAGPGKTLDAIRTVCRQRRTAMTSKRSQPTIMSSPC